MWTRGRDIEFKTKTTMMEMQMNKVVLLEEGRTYPGRNHTGAEIKPKWRTFSGQQGV